MFVIAIWDSKTRKLILIRDRMGEKPLPYSTDSIGGLTFASEAKELFKAG